MSRRISETQLKDLLGIPFSAEQMSAITANLEPGVIIAGAGSGKTTVMAARVVWLVGNGYVSPSEVLGLTFTNKATNELSNRVVNCLAKTKLINFSTDLFPEILTYDSFASAIVSEHGPRIGVDSGTRILTKAQAIELALEVLRQPSQQIHWLADSRPQVLAKAVTNLDSAMNSHLVETDDYLKFTKWWLTGLKSAPQYRGEPYKDVLNAIDVEKKRSELVNLVGEYRERKRQLGLAEFADVTFLATKLVREFPQIGKTLRNRFKIVLLDEYQDTSTAQALILRTVFSEQSPGFPVTAVGDPFQAIYAWRGAAASNILQFANEFPRSTGKPALQFQLQVNRRSGQTILDLANELIDPVRQEILPVIRNGSDTSKAAGENSIFPSPTSILTSGSDIESHVCAHQFATEKDELEWVCYQIEKLGKTTTWSSIAVLARRNTTVAQLYQQLLQRQIPAEIVGLGGLLQLPDIVQIVLTCKLLVDPGANDAVVMLLSSRRWGITPDELVLLSKRAKKLSAEREHLGGNTQSSVLLLDAIKSPGSQLSKGKLGQLLSRFEQELVGLERYLNEPVAFIVSKIIETQSIEVEILSDDEMGETRMRQLDRFRSIVANYSGLEGQTSLSGLVTYFNLAIDEEAGIDQDQPSLDDSVKLLTLHKSKGLEWPHVFIADVTYGHFPSERSDPNFVTNYQTLPARLRGDRDSISQVAEFSKKALEDYKSGLKQSAIRAEDRLAYVGVTRAKENLFLTGSIRFFRNKWLSSSYLEQAIDFCVRHNEQNSSVEPPNEPPTLTISPVEWPGNTYQEVLGQVALQVENYLNQIESGKKITVEFDQLNNLDEAKKLSSWQQTAQRIIRELKQRRSKQQVKLTNELSASQVISLVSSPETFVSNLIRPMPAKPNRNSMIGTLFHNWVQFYYQPQQMLEGIEETNTAASDDPWLQTLISRFKNSPYATLTPVAVEQPFDLVLEGLKLRGRIDAIFEGNSDYDYQIVDWKTFGKQVAEDPKINALQLSIYRLAWAGATCIPVENVDAVYFHVPTGEIERPKTFLSQADIIEQVSDLADQIT